MSNTPKSQRGFTLIEIIAVLIILGILAAVAVPKYMDLTEDAKNRALEGALAEGLSTCTVAYGKLMLSDGGVATIKDIFKWAKKNKPASDEFEYTFKNIPNGVLITVSGKKGSDFAGVTAVTRTWEMP